MSRILEKRDDHFDLCRAVLVVAMVVAHAFQCYYANDYNRNVTFFVLNGFVFLAGFTITAVNAHRMATQNYETSIGIIQRGAKIIVLFLIINFFIASINVSWTTLLSRHSNSIVEFIGTIFLGTDQRTFAFDILVPIGLTLILSVIILNCFKKLAHILILLTMLFTLHILSKWMGILNSYGFSMLLVGCIGSTMGLLTTFLNWDVFIQQITRRNYVFILGYLFIAAYFTLSVFIGQSAYRYSYYHLIPTIILLLFGYIMSYRYHLDQYPIVKFLQQTMSKHMLFAYMFHIGILRASLLLLHKDGYSLWETSLLATAVLLITILSCHALNLLMLRSSLVRETYAFIFR